MSTLSPSSNMVYSSEDSEQNGSYGHFLLGVGLTAAFLTFILMAAVAAYCVGRRRGLAGVLVDPEEAKAKETGLDEATLGAFPKLLFSNASPHVACSVCLADYGESEWLRVLPHCGHVFHLKCVDSWLRLHPTCPLCRKLPATPQLQIS